MNRVLPIVAILLSAALLVWLALWWNPSAPDHAALSSHLAAKPTGGDFALNTAEGRFDTKRVRGKVVVLYFGYTWCPDICPTSLGLLTTAINELSAEELAQVQVVFVSVDPERDTPSRLQDYVRYFHPSYLGATDSAEVVKRVANMYGAAFRKADIDKGKNYSVDHSADLYFLDKQGKLSVILRHGTAPEKILVTLQQLL